MNFAQLDNHLHVKSHATLNAPLLIEETIKSAVAKGLHTITITEHLTLPSGFIDPSFNQSNSLSEPEFDYLIAKLYFFKEKYQNKIEILVGAEVDWLPDYKEKIIARLRKYDLDYINGSVHFVGVYEENGQTVNLMIDSTPELFIKGVELFGGTQQLITKYYAYIRELIQSKIYDNCAHLDLVKKFNVEERLFNARTDWYTGLVEETLKVIAEYGMSIEINTSGLMKPCNEYYPSFWILQRARELNIPLTIGSDAHMPEHVGFDIKDAIVYAKKAGYSEICKYVKHQRCFLKI